MAAGAIPPPLFFGQRRHVGLLVGSVNGILRDTRKTRYLDQRI